MSIHTVSVIITVLNEGSAIHALMESLAAQTRWPDEIVVVDGGSTDGTPEAIRGYAGRLPLRLEVRPGANISQGRNAAIALAQSAIIASTDAGVRLEPGWLAALVEPFEQAADLAPDVVCGFFLADPHSTFEVAMGATVLPRPEEIRPQTFLPSSRSVAFLREAWEHWPYPEWLDYCEDLVFDMGLKELGYTFAFRPAALVHFRPRSTLRAFFKQYYRYARGDGKANIWLKRHLIRYVTYLGALPAGVLLAGLHSPWWLLALLGGAAVYLWPAYRRLGHAWPALSGIERVRALAWVPLLRVVGDGAKMLGYPVGLVWRWEQRGRPEVHWRRQLAKQHAHSIND